MKQCITSHTLFATLILVFSGFLQQAAAQYTEPEVTAFMEARGWTKSADSRYAFLRAGGTTTWWNRDFLSGLEYAIVGFSEDGSVEDVDVEVRDETGDFIRRDFDEDDFALVSFSVDWDRPLGIQLTNYASISRRPSLCRYIIFYR